MILAEVCSSVFALVVSPAGLGTGQSITAGALSSVPLWVVEEKHDGTNARVQAGLLLLHFRISGEKLPNCSVQ